MSIALVSYTTQIGQFTTKGEKSGWMYIVVPQDLAEEMMPGNRKGFRVKGKLDRFAISGVSLLPMGDGSFIIPFNSSMRKGTGKKKGAMVEVKLQVDKKEYELNKEFIECLVDEPEAHAFFNSFSRSVQNYYSKWIDSAKTEETKTKRIAMAINALSKKMDYGLMLRSARKDKIEKDQGY
ncbi:MAG: DUF1905 domain-containing protein [Chitinophagaceae bacterium]|nr:DUF1905 domain-containing protein [Chitinophagaceae bacterium]